MYNADNVISLETFEENTVGARWIFDLETTQDELEAHSLNVENSSPFAFQHMLLRARFRISVKESVARGTEQTSSTNLFP